MHTVLLTDGEFTGLIHCLREGFGRDIRIVSLSEDKYFAHQKFSDAYYIVTDYQHPQYISDLIKIIQTEQVDIVIPVATSSMELILTSEKIIVDQTGAKILSSPLSAVILANNKADLYTKLLAVESLRCYVPSFQTVLTGKELICTAASYLNRMEYICIRRLHGENAEGFRKIAKHPGPDDFFPSGMPSGGMSISALSEQLIAMPADKPFPPYMVCEYLDGQEWDCDVLCHQGKLLSITVRKNIRMSGGLTTVLETCTNEHLENICALLVEELHLSYVSCITFREDSNGKIFLLEINPRFMGNIQVSALAGNNYAKMAIDLMNGDTVFPTKPETGIITSMYQEQIRIDPQNSSKDWTK